MKWEDKLLIAKWIYSLSFVSLGVCSVMLMNQAINVIRFMDDECPFLSYGLIALMAVLMVVINVMCTFLVTVQSWKVLAMIQLFFAIPVIIVIDTIAIATNNCTHQDLKTLTSQVYITTWVSWISLVSEYAALQVIMAGLRRHVRGEDEPLLRNEHNSTIHV